MSSFLFSTCFAFPGVSLILRVSPCDPKSGFWWVMVPYIPLFPASPEVLSCILTGSAQVMCPGQKSWGSRGTGYASGHNPDHGYHPWSQMESPQDNGDAQSAEVSLWPFPVHCGWLVRIPADKLLVSSSS